MLRVIDLFGINLHWIVEIGEKVARWLTRFIIDMTLQLTIERIDIGL